MQFDQSTTAVALGKITMAKAAGERIPEGWAVDADGQPTTDPEAALARVCAWSRRHVIVSVPWEPWFRLGNLARGRHLAHWGDHPEHVHHFGPESLRALLATAPGTAEVETCFPWLIGVIDLRPDER